MTFSPKRYRDYATFLTRHFPFKVQKLAVDAGFTCPNRDGFKGRGGCIYCCNRAFNPRYCTPALSVALQLESGKKFLAHKYPRMKYLAYFQAFSNTYGPLDGLRRLWEEALSVDDVAGIVVATRPDCIDEATLAGLKELSAVTFVMLEFGVETIHEHTLQLINRCHSWKNSIDAINLTARYGIPCGVHLILGLPGETVGDMEASVMAVAQLPVSTVKFHQLQVIKGTKLEHMYRGGNVELQSWTPEQYAHVCAKMVAHLRPDVAIERFVSESPGEMLVFPRWGMKPQEFNLMVEASLQQENLHQGDLYST